MLLENKTICNSICIWMIVFFFVGEEWGFVWAPNIIFDLINSMDRMLLIIELSGRQKKPKNNEWDR